MSFAMLPAELRSLIWEFALPKPRFHLIKSNKMTTKKNIPVLFQINQESREFALKHMPLIFDGTNLAGCDDYHFNYFNPRIDTLCLYDTSDNFKFFMGPWYWHGIPEIAPIKECDMVKSIEIKQKNGFRLPLVSKTGYFQNLERLVVRFQESFRLNTRLNVGGPAEHANRIVDLVVQDSRPYYAFFRRQVADGKIAVIPDIVFILTRSDVRFILSAGVSTLEFSGTRTVMNKAVKELFD